MSVTKPNWKAVCALLWQHQEDLDSVTEYKWFEKTKTFQLFVSTGTLNKVFFFFLTV